MSSMVAVRIFALGILAPGALNASSPLAAQAEQVQDGRAQLVASQPAQAAQAVFRWQQLIANDRMAFEDYAGFLLAYPDYPRADLIQKHAEDALDSSTASPGELVAFFERFPPIGNPARARYALALAAVGRPEAAEAARLAWRGGTMSSPSEAYLSSMFGNQFTPDDQDARMNALLWQGDVEAATRQINHVSSDKSLVFMARLMLLQGIDPATDGLVVPATATSDPGYVYNLVRYYRKTGQRDAAQQLLANRLPFTHPAFDAEDMVGEMLLLARSADPRTAMQIASKVDDLFAPGTDISAASYRLRDDYTSLMWLGGTKALWSLGDGHDAAPLFYRYGSAARTPQTRSKGFFWAGRALARAGEAGITKYLTMAAAYPEYFYGQLALKALGQPLPKFANDPADPVTPAQRAAFAQKPLVQAVVATARNGTDWRTERYFFTALAEQAQNAGQMDLVADLAQQLNLPELAVVVGRIAPEKGMDQFTNIGFPVVANPPGTDFTMVHAIARQESEFDETRTSHAGARGLMQLMPGTAREQADKLGMTYMSANLTGDPQYNLQLGDAYFARMMDYFGGSYPLAVAAYNAGPGNVNKWLRINGDPRNGDVDWLKWIEEIPIFETKNYVQRVLENAVVYESLHPGRVQYGSPKSIDQFIGMR
ncbi:lytic transglycosylase domain-containing protein [Tsuneonella mangrovi]|uniref:lytic transglycosylase domain-containing protein n=1 Tax=Tsuneonella mangrovi TaxID=1982042 RepID=UPI001F0AC365|nr:lytic transglycosylase domain-containing protein [Tsuneonella mangrovi]